MALDTWLSVLGVFLLFGLPLGPNAVHTLSISVSQGLPRGLLAALGMGLAAVVHALLATFGFGAVLLASAALFTALRWLGVAYLAWLGVQMWRNANAPLLLAAPRKPPLTLMLRAAAVSLSNPKAVLAYMAVYPQFIAPQHPFAPQLAVLLPSSVVIVLGIYSGWALLGWRMRGWFAAPRRLRAFNRVVGTAYLGMAGALALARPR